MDQSKLATIGAIVVLAGLVAWQAVRISGLEGRLAVLERQSLAAAATSPSRGAQTSPLPFLRDDNGVLRAPTARTARAQPSAEQIASLVAEEQRQAEAERREQGQERWLESMAVEIERFAVEEQLSQDQVDELQVAAEDYLLTITDFRRAIYEGEISPEAGRAEMKQFRADHESRMVELIGDDAYGRLQRRLGRGGRDR